MVQLDFFLVGAPKCGTTAFDHFLKQHPEIFIPQGKDFDYFSTDLNFPYSIEEKAQYFHYFSSADSNQVVGESSVWYLFSDHAAENIHEHNPEAKIIIMLRDPIEMMYSLYQQQFRNGLEPISNFRDALEAEEKRKEKGVKVPEGIEPDTLIYTDVADYAPQIKRYRNIFQNRQIHIILFDDFAEDNEAVYRDTCRFLGVDDSFTPEFKKINTGSGVRYEWFREFLNLSVVRKITRTIIPHQIRWPLASIVRSLNEVEEDRPPMDTEIKKELRDEFRPKVKRLEQLINLDLSEWY